MSFASQSLPDLEANLETCTHQLKIHISDGKCKYEGIPIRAESSESNVLYTDNRERLGVIVLDCAGNLRPSIKTLQKTCTKSVHAEI